MQKRLSVMLAFVGLLATLGINVPAFADSDDPPFVPEECQTYVGQPSTDHEIHILTAGPYLPGGTIDVEAGTTDTGTGTNRVRIVAILGGTDVIYDNLQVLPSPFGSISDSIPIPADTTPGTSLDIYACFETPGNLTGVGVTHHLNLGSFFVIPESGIGTIALVAGSLAALGGYAVLGKKRLF